MKTIRAFAGGGEAQRPEFDYEWLHPTSILIFNSAYLLLYLLSKQVPSAPEKKVTTEKNKFKNLA